MDEYLEDIFRRNGRIYDGSIRMVRELFEMAIHQNDDETAKALIFPDSPVLTTVAYTYNDSFLQLLCRYSIPNTVIAQLLIDNGVKVDQKNIFAETALHINASYYNHDKNGHLNMLKLLLKNGANREIRNQDGLTPLQLNLFNGNLEMAEEFLNEKDKFPNFIEVDRTKRCRHLVDCLLRETNDWFIPFRKYSILLHFLFLENDEETFQYVAKNSKFDANAFNHRGFMLLHLVRKSGTARMIRMLINMGADPNAVGHGDCQSPLITAMLNPRIEVVYCLLDCGASINKIEKDLRDTNTPLHYAVCVQSYEIVEKLVKLGADVNALTDHRSPLLLACGSIYSRKSYPPIRSRLLKHFTNKTGISYNNIYKFPFSAKIVELLLDHGADVEAKNASNRTSLDQACKFGRLDIVKLLLSRGAKINQGDVSTLHHAVRGENPVIVKLILEQGADVNYRCAPEKMLMKDRYYVSPPPRTPLECALEFILDDSKCRDIIEILLEYGVKVNVAEPVRKETPLHLACLPNKGYHFLSVKAKSRSSTIKLLLRCNDNINALDINGLTPLNYALLNYTLMCGKNTKDNSSSCFKPDLVALIAFIARMIENKEYVIEENLELLEHVSARPIYQECVKELSLMKTNICESQNLSFFDVLSEDIQILGWVLKNEDIFQVLNSDEYKKSFPIYAEYLEDRILEASTRQSLVDLALVLFKKHVNKNIFADLMLKIFKFLSVEDFKIFARACFVDI